VALATLGAVWELFRPFAKMHVPWALVLGLFATWARRRGYLATRDNEETFVRVDLESESPACDVSFDAALERGANLDGTSTPRAVQALIPAVAPEEPYPS